METKLIPLLSISSVLFILIFSILNTAFKDGQFTCNHLTLDLNRLGPIRSSPLVHPGPAPHGWPKSIANIKNYH